MGLAKVNKIQGYTKPGYVQIPLTPDQGHHYWDINELLDGSCSFTPKVADIVIRDGLWVDARAFGTSLNSTTIQAAIDFIGSQEFALLIGHGSWTLSADITIPSNITLQIVRGAIITLGTYDLVINGSLEAGVYQIFDCSSTGEVTGLSEVKLEWFGGGTGATATANSAAFIDAFVAGNVVNLSKGTYVHAGIIVDSEKSILGLGQQTTILDYTSAGVGSAITLRPANTGVHLRGRIKDVQLANSGGTTGWAITSSLEQADIEIGPIYIQGYDKGMYLSHPSQGVIITPRIVGDGSGVAGSIGIQIGSAPNNALNVYIQQPHVSSVESAYIMYGYGNILEKPVWESCITGVKVYGYTQINFPYADATTDDIYVYNNSGYGNLVLCGYMNQSGADKITYETTAVQDRSIVVPMNFGSSHPLRIGAHVLSTNEFSTNTKIRAHKMTAVQSISDNTWTKITLTGEDVDEVSEYSAITSTATITHTGWYYVGGQITFNAPADAKRLNIAIQVNGAAIIIAEGTTGIGSAYPTVSVSDLVYLSTNDTINLYGRQITGGALDVGYGTNATYLYMFRVL